MNLIWKNNAIDISTLNELSKNTMAEHLNILFTEIGQNCLIATMPVGPNTHQPNGLLHGGASAALAETVGSVASTLIIDSEKQTCVGIEINCNHLRSKKTGMVKAIAEPLHIGATTHIWDIKIRDEKEKLICVSRLTVAVLKKPVSLK